MSIGSTEYYRNQQDQAAEFCSANQLEQGENVQMKVRVRVIEINKAAMNPAVPFSGVFFSIKGTRLDTRQPVEFLSEREEAMPLIQAEPKDRFIEVEEWRLEA